jgi:S-adenosylmethionine hydrolase
MPIITLTTDFGGTDFYVAAMKSVLLRQCPGAILVDITHQIFRHDLGSASFTLERAIASFDPGTVHLAVVDPGVGSDRRLIITKINGAIVVCPDNGLITWAWRRHPNSTATELIWRPPQYSSTFHGRDIMAPVAGMIAAGTPIEQLGGDPIDPILLDIEPSNTNAGEVIHIDHFGNATTNIPMENINANAKGFRIGHLAIPYRRTYADVAIGEVVALIGSSDLLEIAIRNGNAADQLDLKIGDRIQPA